MFLLLRALLLLLLRAVAFAIAEVACVWYVFFVVCYHFCFRYIVVIVIVTVVVVVLVEYLFEPLSVSRLLVVVYLL